MRNKFPGPKYIRLSFGPNVVFICSYCGVVQVGLLLLWQWWWLMDAEKVVGSEVIRRSERGHECGCYCHWIMLKR